MRSDNLRSQVFSPSGRSKPSVRKISMANAVMPASSSGKALLAGTMPFRRRCPSEQKPQSVQSPSRKRWRSSSCGSYLAMLPMVTQLGWISPPDGSFSTQSAKSGRRGRHIGPRTKPVIHHGKDRTGRRCACELGAVRLPAPPSSTTRHQASRRFGKHRGNTSRIPHSIGEVRAARCAAPLHRRKYWA